MRVSSSLAFVVAAWGFALAPRTARAQIPPPATGPSVTAIVGTVQRLESNGTSADDPTHGHPHTNTVPVSALNFEDCEANLTYQFTLLISGINPSYNLQAWAGSQDCSQLANRQPATAVCWPLLQNPIPQQNPTTTTIRMRDIASQAATSSHNVNYVAATEAVCGAQQGTGASAISVYFFFTDQSGNAVGTGQTYAVSVDTRAGDVQGSISLGVGGTLLIVNIPPTTDPDTKSWNVYCDPPPGEEGLTSLVPPDAPSNNGQCAARVPDTGTTSVSEAGDALASFDSSSEASVDSAVPVVDSAAPLDDAGGNPCGVLQNDAGIPSPGGCSASSVLVYGGGSFSTGTTTLDEAGNVIVSEAGTFATTDEAGATTTTTNGGNMVLIPSRYLCGTGDVTSTQINVLGLKDGVYYNIAVAAVDAVANVGPLSNVPCGEPVPVNDFWALYYQAGGRAGGGFCSAEGAGTPAGTSGLGALMIASIVAMVRRRRRK